MSGQRSQRGRQPVRRLVRKNSQARALRRSGRGRGSAAGRQYSSAIQNTMAGVARHNLYLNLKCGALRLPAGTVQLEQVQEQGLAGAKGRVAACLPVLPDKILAHCLPLSHRPNILQGGGQGGAGAGQPHHTRAQSAVSSAPVAALAVELQGCRGPLPSAPEHQSIQPLGKLLPSGRLPTSGRCAWSAARSQAWSRMRSPCADSSPSPCLAWK